MNSSDISSDDDFLSAFNNCSASPSAFDHLGHLRIGWIHLQRYPLEIAVKLTCDGIERFASHLGVPGKYNRTLSEALLRIMASRGAADKSKTWAVFLNENPDLVGGALELLGKYYSMDYVMSPLAKKVFMTPDLSALP